jgi:hypothetical protein
MPRPNPQTRIAAIDLMSRFMGAMALGVFCAGLLLSFDQQINLAAVIIVRQQWLARLIFLLWIGVSFGVGVTLAKVL